MKKIGRRQFMGYLGGMVGVTLFGRFADLSLIPRSTRAAAPGLATGRALTGTRRRLADSSGSAARQGVHLGMVIDAGACIGCRKCMWACKEENNTTDAISPLWIEVFALKGEVGVTGQPTREELREGTTTSYTESPKPGMWYLPVQCYHCDNPPCVKVCPTGATYKDKDGLVLMDYEKCIGCRFCVVACPYSARRFTWEAPKTPVQNVNPLVPLRPVGVVEKCTFCVHRVREGKLPRCVEVCPVQARHFGDFDDPASEVSKLLAATPSFRLLEELNTGPNIRYITRGKKYARPA